MTDDKKTGVWKYDNLGCVTITWEDGKSLFMQSEDDIKSFFRYLGLSLDQVFPGDFDSLPESIDWDYHNIAE